MITMIQFELKEKELDEALHRLRKRTIQTLITDERFRRSLTGDRDAIRQVADAIDVESNLTRLLGAFWWLCRDENSVKLVEAICKELPAWLRRVFLDDVVYFCGHPDYPLREDTNALRLVAFAEERKARMKLRKS